MQFRIGDNVRVNVSESISKSYHNREGVIVELRNTDIKEHAMIKFDELISRYFRLSSITLVKPKFYHYGI
jgi:ribosomal protein L19